MKILLRKFNMPSVGERLKRARIALSFDLEEVSKKIRIRKEYLGALEEGNYHTFSASPYLKGVLVKYTEFLGLNKNYILRQHKKEIARVILSCRKTPIDSVRPFITPKLIYLVTGLLAISLFGCYVWYQLHFLFGPPKLVIETPREDEMVYKDSLELTGEVDQNSVLTVNDEEVYLSQTGRFSKIINLQPGLNVLKIKAVSLFGRTNEIIRRVILK